MWNTNKEYAASPYSLGTGSAINPGDPGDDSPVFKFKADTQVTIDLDNILAFNRTIDKILINGASVPFTLGSTFNLVLDSDKVIDITYKNLKSPQSYLDITFLSGVSYKLLTESRQFTNSELEDLSFTSGSPLSPIDTSDYESILIMSSTFNYIGSDTNGGRYNSKHFDSDSPWNNFRMYTEYPGGTASNILNKNEMITDQTRTHTSSSSGGPPIWWHNRTFTYMYIQIPLSSFTDAGYNLNTPIYIKRLLED